MSIADLHDIAEKLHDLEQKSRGTVEDESVKLTRKLAIDLVRYVDRLEERIAELEGKPRTGE